jgi:hypothetical protein
MGASALFGLCCKEMIIGHFHSEMGASALFGLCCKEMIIEHFHSEMGASPPAAGTGLSACIFFAAGKKGYRFYPLRWRTPAESALSKPLRGFDFTESYSYAFVLICTKKTIERKSA